MCTSVRTIAIVHVRAGIGQGAQRAQGVDAVDAADARPTGLSSHFAATAFGFCHRLFGTRQCTFFSAAEIAPTRQSIAALASP
jgi:hypothetical protein